MSVAVYNWHSSGFFFAQPKMSEFICPAATEFNTDIDKS